MLRLIGLLIGLFSVSIVNAAPSLCSEHQCLAVVDAGSTGSRLHLFAYDLDDHHSPVQIHEIFSKKAHPGFASLESNQASIHQYLTHLLGDSLDLDHPVPLYFYATAGMRLLPSQKQESYYHYLKQWFSNQSQWQLISAKTISGSDEGVLGWLAVNYELGTLASSEKPLVGVLDTGGASVQVTFPTLVDKTGDNNDYVQVDIYGRHFQLFAHSFLGLGQNEVMHQLMDVRDCFSNNYPLPNGSLAQGDVSLCEKNVFSLLDGVHHVGQIVKSALEENPVSTWYAIGGLGYLVQMSPFDFADHQFTPKDMADQADQKVCHADWSYLNNQYPENDYLYGSCLNASLFHVLLVEGYGLNQFQAVHYLPAETNSNDWTLGVVLHHS